MTDMVPKSPPKWGKIRDLAAALGNSERYARKLRAGGRVVTGLGGLIDIPASLRLIAATRDPARGGKPDRWLPKPPPAASQPAPEAAEVCKAPVPRPQAWRSPCMLAPEGCRGLDPALDDNCRAWDATDVMMTGFKLGWLANGPPGALESFLRDGDPDLSLYESLQGHLATAVLRVLGSPEEAAPEAPDLAPDPLAEDCP